MIDFDGELEVVYPDGKVRDVKKDLSFWPDFYGDYYDETSRLYYDSEGKDLSGEGVILRNKVDSELLRFLKEIKVSGSEYASAAAKLLESMHPASKELKAAREIAAEFYSEQKCKEILISGEWDDSDIITAVMKGIKYGQTGNL